MNKEFDFAFISIKSEKRFDVNLEYFENHIFGVSRELTDEEKEIVGKYYCKIVSPSCSRYEYRVETKLMSLEEMKKSFSTTFYIKKDKERNEYIIV